MGFYARYPSGASGLPAGAATAANQVIEISELQAIDAKVLTDAQLRASPVPTSTTNGLTDTQLRASPVPVTGPLTDTQLRASPIPVTGGLTDAELRASPVDVQGPLTDAELRANPVDVTGTVSTDGLTDAELRAAPVDIQGPVNIITGPAGGLSSTALTVGTTAQRLTVSGSAPNAARTNLTVTIDASNSGKFYVGGSTVTASGPGQGIQLVASQVFIANNDAADYYIISDTAAQIVQVMEQV